MVVSALRLESTAEVDDVETARSVMALVGAGRTDEALGLVAQIRRAADLEDESEHGDVEAAAQRATALLWAAFVEGRRDERALSAGRALIASPDRSIGSAAAAALHFQLGMCVLADAQGVTAEIASARESLTHARTLAGLAGADDLEAAARIGLAVIDLVTGNLLGAEMRAGDLRPGASDEPRRTSWGVQAELVQLCVAHLRGREMPVEVVDELRSSTHLVRHDPISRMLLASVEAFDGIHRGDLYLARARLELLLEDPYLARLAPWRIGLLVTDGLLASHAGDLQRATQVISRLTSVGAAGDAAVVRAAQQVAVGNGAAAMTALRPVSSGAIQAAPLNRAHAVLFEAALRAQKGTLEEAERSFREALAITGPHELCRVFAMADKEAVTLLLQRALRGRPTDGWVRRVDEFVTATTPLGPPVAVWEDEVETGPSEEPVAPVTSPLTEREREVLALVRGGTSQSQLAHELYVSPNTIKTHLRSIRRKLGVESTGDAAALADHAGWLTT